jgi:hypothetical protein
MRLFAVVGVLVAVGCGFDPHQTYLDFPDASGDRMVTLDTKQNDLQATAGPPDAADAGKLDMVASQRPDSSDAGRTDVWTSPPDLAPARPETGPEVQVPDSRAGDAQPEALPVQPDTGADLMADLFASPDAYQSDLAPDRSPDLSQRDAGSDLSPPCSGCADPAWACMACINEGHNSIPVLIQCVGGMPYDCNGQFMRVQGICGTANTQSCISCNRVLTCPAYAPGCLSEIRCPDPAPYCNATTGACSATPI